MKVAGAVLALLLLMSFSIWAWFAAPCGFYSYSKVSETPARCLMPR